MDIDTPEARAAAAAAAVPATPPQSNNNTPQRDAGPTSSNGGQRQADSAVPESPLMRPISGNDDDAFDEDMEEEAPTRHRAVRGSGLRSHLTTSKSRNRGRGKTSGEFEGDLDELQRIEHTDFFNSFGQDWDNPK
ncbi:hypothetical protein LPJ59_002792 [Coemansia sp. RSA 2399]|nr:hypothetical protein LPJ59_002792 [Coemansia sp. RSA 2399]KAJ1904551.1 hypothetical protein LPJ81_002431 [Coemansia sp. IMI 209127]